MPLAVRFAVCAEVTAEAVAEKLALVEPEATSTDAGTTTRELSLARVTVTPPLGAAALNVIVQVSVPDPVMDALAQERALSAGIAGSPAQVPLPEPGIVTQTMLEGTLSFPAASTLSTM